jgi:Transposase DDE domain
VRRLLPEARALALVAHDYEQGGAKPVCAWNDPTDIDRVVTELVSDAQTVLDVAASLPLSETAQEAVGLLALVAGQDVEPGDGEGTWRVAQRTAYDRIVSAHDPESRHFHKTVHSYRDGFKAHIAVEPETGVVTACDLTAGNVGDAQAASALLERESAGTEALADGKRETRLELATLPWQGTALNLYSGGGENGAKATTYPQFPRGSTLITQETTLTTRPSTPITIRWSLSGSP